MTKKQIQSEESKKRFVEAARVLFAQKGYKGTTIEDIVRLAGGSKGNLYYHFTNKEGLLIYLLEALNQEFNLQWEEKANQYTNIEDTLYALAERLLDSDLIHPVTKSAEDFFDDEWNNSEVKRMIEAHVTNHIALSRSILEKSMEKGELAPDDSHMLAIILGALFEGLGNMSRYCPGATLTLYRKAIHILLHGMKFVK